MPGSARQGLRDDMFGARPSELGSEEVVAATSATDRHLGCGSSRSSCSQGSPPAWEIDSPPDEQQTKGLRSYIDIGKLVEGGVAVAVGVEGH